MRFPLLFAAAIATVLVTGQAYAVPSSQGGWCDQGGKWHTSPHDTSFGTFGCPSNGVQTHAVGAQNNDSNDGQTNGAGGASGGGGDTGPSDGANIGLTGEDSGDPPSSGFSGPGLDIPLSNDDLLDGVAGPQHGAGDPSLGDIDIHDAGGGSPGGVGNNDAPGGRNGDGAAGQGVDPPGAAVPEPSSMALILGALAAAGGIRRRKREK